MPFLRSEAENLIQHFCDVMKKSFLLKGLLVAGLSFSPWVLTAQTPESREAGASQPPKEGTNADKPDLNAKGPPSPQRDPAVIFARLDADGNGSLSKDEFAKFFERRGRRDGERKKGDGAAPARVRDKKTEDANKAETNERAKLRGDEKANESNTSRSGGSTGGTGSSASGSAADGSANTGTADPKP